nr:hypothetical protein [Moritella viscosa]SHO17743.1 Phage protein [Moritella viscosa]
MKVIKKIPIINVAYRITNAYVYKGDLIHLKKTAPIAEWVNRIGKNLFFSIVVGIILYLISSTNSTDTNFDPENAILSIFPDILGFGIGVFALLFALPNEFLLSLRKSVKNSKGENKITGPQMLPADMAFPLLVYSIIMLFSVFFMALPNEPITTCLSTIFLVYGFVVTLELLSSIFMTASYMLVIRNSSIDDNESKNDNTTE